MKQDNIIATIKLNITKNMEANGLKRYTLAEKAGIANPTIQNWFTKRNYQPSLDSLIKVGEVFNMSLSQMCLGEDEELYPVNSELKDFISLYLQLDNETRQIVNSLVKKLRME